MADQARGSGIEQLAEDEAAGGGDGDDVVIVLVVGGPPRRMRRQLATLHLISCVTPVSLRVGSKLR